MPQQRGVMRMQRTLSVRQARGQKTFTRWGNIKCIKCPPDIITTNSFGPKGKNVEDHF